MEHSFDSEIAKKYGVNCAILLKNIYFWVEKNRANNKNFYDGNYWTYNSKKAFAELFPYMNERQIEYALKKLLDERLIITGNYNKLTCDRTLWYAITEKGYAILQHSEVHSTKLWNGTNKIVECIPQNCGMEPTKLWNAIPDNINTDIIPDIKKESKRSFDEIINSFTDDLEIRTLLGDWLKIRKAKKVAMTNRVIELNLKELPDLAKKSGLTITEYLKEAIRRGWHTFYEINNSVQPFENGNKSNNKNTALIRQREYTKEDLDNVFNKNIDDWI